MTENAYGKEQLNNGAFAYVIRRKLTPEKPLLIHFGLDIVHIAVCGLCMCAKLFKFENNLEDVIIWCLKHWRWYSTAHDGIEAHNAGECHSQKVLRNLLLDSIGTTNARRNIGGNSRGEPRNILLPEAWIRTIFGQEALENRQTVKVCNCCLKETTNARCCSANTVIQVSRLKASRNVQGLLCTDDAGHLAHEATVLGCLASTEQVVVPPPAPNYPPPPQTVVNSSPAPPLFPTTNTTPEPPPTLLPNIFPKKPTFKPGNRKLLFRETRPQNFNSTMMKKMVNMAAYGPSFDKIPSDNGEKNEKQMETKALDTRNKSKLKRWIRGLASRFRRTVEAAKPGSKGAASPLAKILIKLLNKMYNSHIKIT